MWDFDNCFVSFFFSFLLLMASEGFLCWIEMYYLTTYVLVCVSVSECACIHV